jgi:pyruvyltransferase
VVTIHVKQFQKVANVGDAIGGRIVAEVTGRPVQLAGEEPLDVPNLIAAGSIAHWADPRSILWGCGMIDERHPPVCRPARVLAVRGRLTRDMLTRRGVPCSDIVCDVGFLLPDLIPPSAERTHAIGIVPHYVDRTNRFVARLAHEGAAVVDPGLEPEEFVARLTSCQRILSSSLHGLILAHAYGLDAAWVRLSRGVYGRGFKFADYCSSVGLDRREVRHLSPRRHSLDRMLEACWRPEKLPDKAAMRAVLAEAASALDA